MSIKRYINRELRSDHAGEVGAVQIYQGIKAVARLRGDMELVQFAETHGVVEKEHLKMMEELVPVPQRSKLQVPWRIAGWLTGAIPALFGRNTVYATIQAVETFVDEHYQQQIDKLSPYPVFNTLVGTLKKCQADEVHHKNDAGSRVVSTNAVLKLWVKLINIGSRGAVSICRIV